MRHWIVMNNNSNKDFDISKKYRVRWSVYGVTGAVQMRMCVDLNAATFKFLKNLDWLHQTTVIINRLEFLSLYRNNHSVGYSYKVLIKLNIANQFICEFSCQYSRNNRPLINFKSETIGISLILLPTKETEQQEINAEHMCVCVLVTFPISFAERWTQRSKSRGTIKIIYF